MKPEAGESAVATPSGKVTVDMSGSSEEPESPAPRDRTFVPPEPRELDRHFPQLEILELLGQGGMGVVYKARQPGLDRLVALKILPPEESRDPAFAERFTREARALAKLSHPNIVAVYDFGKEAGLYYFVMEFVEGANIRQLMRTGQRSAREALAIIPQICDALQYAHEEGIVHRDIKPENILLDKKGRVKIADFGLAKLLGRKPAGITLTGPRHVMGTLHYMAPEQMEKPQEVDHRADIYSLGVVFYEMLTGELPLGRFAPPSQKVQVDVRLDEVVLRALEKDPERRYQNVGDVKTDVETVSSGAAKLAAPAAATAGGAGQAPTLSKRLHWSRLAAVMLVVAVCLLAFELLRDNPRDNSRDNPDPGAPVDFNATLQQLMDPEISFGDKEPIWQKIREPDLINQAIASLEKRAKENPENPDFQFELGVAYIQKVITTANNEEKGIAARKADRAFDAALDLDKYHWLARFYKAVSLSFWPPIFGMQAEAIRQFEILLKQQEERPPRPEFSQTYFLLGNLYQQRGNVEKARETWKRGLAFFPDDKDLNKRIVETEPEE